MEGMGLSECEDCDGVNFVDPANGKNHWVAGPKSNQSYVVLQDGATGAAALDALLCQGRRADHPSPPSPPPRPDPDPPPPSPPPRPDSNTFHAFMGGVALAAIVGVGAVMGVRRVLSERHNKSLATEDSAMDAMQEDPDL